MDQGHKGLACLRTQVTHWYKWNNPRKKVFIRFNNDEVIDYFSLQSVAVD